jgi:hypothetical protein
VRIADVGGEEFGIAPAGVIADVGDQRRHDPGVVYTSEDKVGSPALISRMRE